MKKIFFLIIFLTGLLTYAITSLDLNLDTFVGKAAMTETYFVQDSGQVELYFCPSEICERALVEFLASAKKSIDCALFEIDLPGVQKILREQQQQKVVRVVIDEQYYYEFPEEFVKTDRWGLMHNKFCIVDGRKISTGSMNPTVNDAFKNNNNLLLIESELLTANYQQEFEELWNGTFKKGARVQNAVIKVNTTIMKSYFCPEDGCAQRVKEELKKARHSIHFMTFSFTHEGIANILLLKNLDGVVVQGVMEARQVTKDSQFMRLHQNKVLVHKDGNKNNMHHKVFIIDERIVITGSFNPTNGGDERNDENLIIIEDETIAAFFMEEFAKIWQESKP